MHVFYNIYQLTPLKRANRLSSVKPQIGVHLKIRKRFTNHFADYFPHLSLGDGPVELFLEKFKFQENDYQKKILYFLLNEEELRSQKIKNFKNHQLWDGSSEILSSVVKYKLNDPEDMNFYKAIQKGFRVRLDANGLFNPDNLQHFIKKIPHEYLPFIEYLEDPMNEINWPSCSIPFAEDFIHGSPSAVIIHKPNARFFPVTEKKVIFSSYLGSDLGLWHSYLELIQKGDLGLFHGIVTKGFYQEERLRFDSSVAPIESDVRELYNDLENTQWKLLCSI
jgi:hypothetical protein